MVVSAQSIVIGFMLFSIFNLAYAHKQENYSKAANFWGAALLTAFYSVLLWLSGAWA